jgi:hypothetical protein
MEIGNPILNTSPVGNFFQIPTYLELLNILCLEGCTKAWSDRLVVNLIPKPPELHFG